MPAGYPRLLPLLVCAALLLLTGCPPHEKSAAKPPAADVPPAMPAHGKLLAYENLHLGMSSVDISQAYNAPEGQGKGFKRVIEDFNDVQHHIVTFETKDTEPQRKLVLALYQDQLYELVDRRDGLTADQAKAWHTQLEQRYGPPAAEPVRGAQWTWGPEHDVLLTYTQDNASDNYMSANVVIVFKPYEDAAYKYLADWEKAHPAETKQ